MKSKFWLFVGLVMLGAAPLWAAADPLSLDQVFANSLQPQRLSAVMEAVIFLTFLSLVPALMILTTCFMRFVIVLSFLRHALGLQQTPPNQVLLSLALVLTLFVMGPTFAAVHAQAIKPYQEKTMDWKTALEKGRGPLQEFLLRQTRKRELKLALQMSRSPLPATPQEVPFLPLVTAFALSELKTAFQIGFVIFLPFLVVDLVVASVLLSLGMMMVPPSLVSLPIKIILFVLVDGWAVLAEGLVRSVR